MAEDDVEQLEISLEEHLIASDIGTLSDICSKLELSSKLWKDKSKMHIIKSIRKFTDLEDLNEKKITIAKILELFMVAETTSSYSVKQSGEMSETKINEQVKELESMLSKLKTEMNGGGEVGNKDSTKLLEETLSKTMLKKEFKITGNINDQKRTDKPSLSYISLIHQIEAAQHQDYSDLDIINAIIKAMSPGMKLRTVLETLPNLKLPRVRLMFRSHYSEKSAAELFQQLTNCIQATEESADEFLIRVYEIRQKLIFARKESGSITVPYDDALIQTIFINTIETGLISETIRNKVRPYLTLPKPGQTEQDFELTNDILIHQTNIATATEIERTEKLKSVRRRTGVSTVNTIGDETDSQQSSKKKLPNKEEDSQLVATLQAIQSQLGTLRQDVNQLRANAVLGNQNRPSRPMCKRCTTDKNEFCDHCFRCGATDHFARGCKQSTNSNRR